MSTGNLTEKPRSCGVQLRGLVSVQVFGADDRDIRAQLVGIRLLLLLQQVAQQEQRLVALPVQVLRDRQIEMCIRDRPEAP